METTVRDLGHARIRHVLYAVVFAGVSIALWHYGQALASDPLSGSSRSLKLIVWGAGLTALSAAYQLWQWRRKTRRYRYQRLRAANQLLRADFRRTGRI